MRKLFAIAILSVAVCIPTMAQRDVLKSAAQHISNLSPFVVNVTQTRQDASSGKSSVAKGNFYFRSAKLHSMVFRNNKEMLLAQNDEYTIVKDGKKHSTKANGKGLNPFETINEILRNALYANEKTPLTKQAKISYSRQGQNCVVSITPIRSGFLASLKALYKSCSLTIDTKTGEIKSLYIHERGNYKTRYDFSNCRAKAKIDNSAFELTM